MNNARNVDFKFEALFSAAVTVQGMTGAVYYYLIVAAELCECLWDLFRESWAK